jgi:hypothetical protein
VVIFFVFFWACLLPSLLKSTTPKPLVISPFGQAGGQQSWQADKRDTVLIFTVFRTAAETSLRGSEMVTLFHIALVYSTKSEASLLIYLKDIKTCM